MVLRLSSGLLALVALYGFASNSVNAGFVDPDEPSGTEWNAYYNFDFRTEGFDSFNKTWVAMKQPVYRPGGTTRSFQANNTVIDNTGIAFTVYPEGVNATGGMSVPCAGAFTKSKDFGFGVYHFEVQFTNVVGTVQAMYVYKNDSSEVDLESPNPDGKRVIDYSVKPQLRSASGGPDQSTFRQAFPTDDLSSGYHNFSFIWTKDYVKFALDNVWDDNSMITTNVPQDPGILSLSHWSDGNSGYSGGPPTESATMRVTRVWAYYTATPDSFGCLPNDDACLASEKPKPTKSSTSSGSKPSTTKKSAGERSWPMSFGGLAALTAAVAALL